jgi:hypothetical protein
LATEPEQPRRPTYTQLLSRLDQWEVTIRRVSRAWDAIPTQYRQRLRRVADGMETVLRRAGRRM